MTSGVAPRYSPRRRISAPVSPSKPSMFPRIFSKTSSSPRRAARSKLLGRTAHRSLTAKPASSSIAMTLPIRADRDIFVGKYPTT